MRVIHVITRLIVGGAQENTVASVLGLRQKPGLDVTLVAGPTLGPEGSLESLFAGCPPALTVVPELVRPVNPWLDCLAWKKLTELFRARRPDIVHTHSGKAGILGRLAAARAGVPIILHTIHGPSFGPFQGPLANSVFRAAERYAGRVTTHFVVVADALKRQYLNAGIGHPDQYTKIFSGFPLEPFLAATNDLQIRAKLGLTRDDIVIGKIARLFKLKGHDDLLTIAPELVRLCPQVKFLLVGDGAWRGRLGRRGQQFVQQRFAVQTMVGDLYQLYLRLGATLA
jgi:glycosyltransferase involved in cell wall biosynthesis